MNNRMNTTGVFFPRDIVVIPTRVLENDALTPIDKLVYGAYYTMNNTVNDLMDCTRTIADHLKLTTNQVEKAEWHLRDLGYITYGGNTNEG